MTYPQVGPKKNADSKAILKRAHSDGDSGSHGSKTSSSEMLLQIPIEDDKDDPEKLYGGFAYDHVSLPIIVAVHSISANAPQTVQKDDDYNEKNEVEKKSLEVPTHCITTKDDSKLVDKGAASCQVSLEWISGQLCGQLYHSQYSYPLH